MTDSRFDYVVVGAGSAGCVLAARLTQNTGVRVALVEAGGLDDAPAINVPMDCVTLFGSEVDWNYATVAQPGLDGRVLPWPRGKVLGGSSAINFQMWVPGHRDDYLPWADAGGQEWSWEAVEPYFRAAETWKGDPDDGKTFGTEGPLYISPPRDPDPVTELFLGACAELGLKELPGGLGGGDPTGCAVTPLNQLRGTRWSSADGYLRPAMTRPNLSVLTGEQVRKVVIEEGRATGVELAGRTLTATREVILSAGAVGSPQLLMLSGVGDPRHLAELGIDCVASVPGVGRNLQDHFSLTSAVRVNVPIRLVGADTPENRARYEREQLGPLTSNMVEAVAFLRGDRGQGAPDIEVLWSPIAFTDKGPVPAVALVVVLLQPESRGRITLADADPLSHPLIDPRYLTAEADLPALVRGVRFAERLLETEALAPIVGEPVAPWPGTVDEDTLVATIHAHGTTLFHPVGTCALGTGPDAVVDPHLRVRDVGGLRVVDASVFPTLPRGHTHAAVTMVAERAARFIRAQVG